MRVRVKHVGAGVRMEGEGEGGACGGGASG